VIRHFTTLNLNALTIQASYHISGALCKFISLFSGSSYDHGSKAELSRPLPFSGGQIPKWPELNVFSFEELKSATSNFRSDSLVGEGGFGRIYKGWLDENTLTPAKPGSGVAVAIKMLNPGSLQGFHEWQVALFSSLSLAYFKL